MIGTFQEMGVTSDNLRLSAEWVWFNGCLVPLSLVTQATLPYSQEQMGEKNKADLQVYTLNLAKWEC